MTQRTALVVMLISCVPASAQDTLDDRLDRPVRSLPLAGSLGEASGLAFDGDGRLWSHDDERGMIRQLDPSTGEILATHRLGPKPVRGDFEGLAFDGRLFHLVTSGGTLVSFPADGDATIERYTVRETAAGSWCEVEGIALDPVRNTLTLACKEVLQEELSDRLVLLEVDIPPGPTAVRSRPLPVRAVLTISRDDLRELGLPGTLRLSGIAYDPHRDAWFLVAARERRLLVVDRAGTVLEWGRLRAGRHPQPEGVAYEPGSRTLFLVDEGGRGPGRLTSYSFAGVGSGP